MDNRNAVHSRLRNLTLCWRVCLTCLALAIGFLCHAQSFAGEPIPPEGRHLAATRTGNADVIASIDSPSRIQLFSGQKNAFQPIELELGAPRLVPGAPLVLTAIDKRDLPQVLTIGADGRFLRVTPHQPGVEVAAVEETSIPPDIAFPPGGDFAFAQRAGRTSLFAIDGDGMLREFDGQTGAPVLVEGRGEVLLPGGAVRTLVGEGNELFLIDRRGNLVSYVRDPIVRWKGPRLIGTGFVAGSDVALWRRPDQSHDLQLAAVNARGELLVGRLEPTGWKLEMAPGWLLPPGSPLAVAHAPLNLRLCAVAANGDLLEMHLENTEWRERIVAAGLSWKSNVVMMPNGPAAFGIDLAGNLITAIHAEEAWTTHLVSPDPSVTAVRLLDRRWTQSEGADVRELVLANRSDEEIVVRLRDRREPGAIREWSLAAGGTATVSVASDSAGELVDRVQAIAGDDSVSESPHPVVTPLQSRYEIEVLAIREGAVDYVDLRQTPWPPVAGGRQPLSLGGFAIPAGDVVPSGTTIDLCLSASARRVVPVEP